MESGSCSSHVRVVDDEEEQQPPGKQRKMMQEEKSLGSEQQAKSTSSYAEIFKLLCHRRKNRKRDPELDQLVHIILNSSS